MGVSVFDRSDKAEAYQQGRRAAFAAVPFTENPYSSDVPRAAWLDGYVSVSNGAKVNDD